MNERPRMFRDKCLQVNEAYGLGPCVSEEDCMADEATNEQLGNPDQEVHTPRFSDPRR